MVIFISLNLIKQFGFKMKILVFGNPLVREDSLPLRIVKQLRQRFPSVEFKEFDSAENLEEEGRNLIILDAAKGIEDIILLEDIESIRLSSRYSMHDFDLSITLRLLKKLDAIDSVKIIAVPADYEADEAIEEISGLISSLLSKSG